MVLKIGLFKEKNLNLHLILSIGVIEFLHLLASSTVLKSFLKAKMVEETVKSNKQTFLKQI